MPLKRPAMSRQISTCWPSGELHLGNYLGPLRHWPEMIDEFDCYFFLADLHTITVPLAAPVALDVVGLLPGLGHGLLHRVGQRPHLGV